MKLFYTVFVFFLSLVIATTKAQNFGVVCTYDYQQTLNYEDINSFDPLNIPPLSYVVVNSYTEDSIHLTPKNTFQEMMDGYITRKNLVLYVHGDHSLLSDLLSKGSEFSAEYNTDFLMFVWPSNEIQNASRKNYRNSKLNTIAVMPGFVQTIEEVSKYCESKGIKLTVMFHSLGNLLAKNFVRLSIAKNEFSPLFIHHIILNAACVWENDHDLWVEILAKRIKGSLYITYNENDAILNLAKDFIEKGDLLGMTPAQTKSVSATYVDFTDILRNKASIHESHGYFLGNIIKQKPELKIFYEEVFKP